MAIQYKTIDTRSAAGLKQAEKLKAQGWQIGSVGFSTIQLYKKPKGYTEKFSLSKL